MTSEPVYELDKSRVGGRLQFRYLVSDTTLVPWTHVLWEVIAENTHSWMTGSKRLQLRALTISNMFHPDRVVLCNFAAPAAYITTRLASTVHKHACSSPEPSIQPHGHRLNTAPGESALGRSFYLGVDAEVKS